MNNLEAARDEVLNAALAVAIAFRSGTTAYTVPLSETLHRLDAAFQAWFLQLTAADQSAIAGFMAPTNNQP